MEDDSSDRQSQNVELYVKAGRDGRSIGGCPLCHRIAMILAVKSGFTSSSSSTESAKSASPMTFSVTPINLARPAPDSFRKSIGRLPAVVHDGNAIVDPDELVAYIDCRFPEPDLADCSDESAAAEEASRDVFSKFSFYIRDVAHSPGALLQELKRLDTYLVQSGHRFLTRNDRLSHLDCILLPKLQHVRVAAKALRDFDIPTDLVGLWRYLDNAYRSREFRDTCPSDQEIICHWLEKQDCMKVFGKSKMALLVEGSPTYSMEIPAEIKL